MAGCRDCSRCTETSMTSCLMALPRLIYAVCWGIWAGMFKKKCPQCGHLMSMHKMVEGRFVD